MDCGGKRSATPLWMFHRHGLRAGHCGRIQSGVAAVALPPHSMHWLFHGLRWEAKRHIALDVSSAWSPRRTPRKNPKRCRRCRSATAVHTLTLPWTAVGSEAPHRFGCFIGMVSAPDTAEESKAVSPLSLCHRSPYIDSSMDCGGNDSVRGPPRHEPGFAVRSSFACGPGGAALPFESTLRFFATSVALRLCGELFLDLPRAS
jgi:hypothetical protein